MDSEVLRCLSERGAQSFSLGFSSLKACKGWPRHSTDLGDFLKAQPLALIILTPPAQAFEYVRIMPTNPHAYNFEDEPELGVSAYAVRVNGFPDFQALRTDLTEAFNQDAQKVGLRALKILGLYMCPETGPARRVSVEDITQMAFQLEATNVRLPPPRRSGSHPDNR